MEEEKTTMTLSTAEYTRLCQVALEKRGIDPRMSDMVTESLLWCDLHGISSHGLNMLPTYLERLERGGIVPNLWPVTLQQKGAIAVLDGKGGFGQVIARVAAELACELAGEHGVGVVSVRNANHAGALGFFTGRIASAGCIGFMASNSNPTVAPFGGRKPALGTNPLSFAFPGETYPVIVDLATSATAKGKLYEIARQSDTIPPGLVLNADGEPTTSVQEALKGILLPLGGPKGYALAVSVEILTGLLSGGKLCKEIDSFHRAPDKSQDVSMFVAAFALDAFLSQEEYLERLSRMEGYLKATPTMRGYDCIYLPGEREALLAIQRQQEGLPISENLYSEVQKYIQE